MSIQPVINVLGNFGVSFLTPLTSGNIAEQIYDVGLDFGETIIVALLAAVFYTGLSISREAASWKKKEWKKNANGDK